jgi:hypothetical protein
MMNGKGIRSITSRPSIQNALTNPSTFKELGALLQEAKGRAARIEEPSELWDLESWLTERRREIDQRYDYRYSILPLVFAQLLRDGRVTEDDLHGLGQEKLDLIRRASAI